MKERGSCTKRRNFHEYRCKECDLRRGVDRAGCRRRVDGNRGADWRNHNRHIDNRDNDNNQTGHAAFDSARYHDNNARRDDAECEYLRTTEHRRDRNAECEHLLAFEHESFSLDAADAVRLSERGRNEWLHDANDTDIPDEHDYSAHIAHGDVADGLSERSDAGPGCDDLPLIRGHNRNGSGSLVFLRRATR